MSKIATQIRVDYKLKRDAQYLFDTLGLDMSTAINLFLSQCILNGGLPFEIKKPVYNEETLRDLSESLLETQQPSIVFDSVEEMNKDLFGDI